MAVTFTHQAHAAVLQAAEQAHPNEACGLLLGTPTHIAAVLPTANVHPEPARHFEIDPAALIAAHKASREAARAGGPQLIGYFHSHPNGLARPSATDAASASGDGRIWAIAASGAITLWRDTPSGFEPLSYAIKES
jgi:desampylase